MPVFSPEEQARFRAWQAEQTQQARLIEIWTDCLAGKRSAEASKAILQAEFGSDAQPKDGA